MSDYNTLEKRISLLESVVLELSNSISHLKQDVVLELRKAIEKLEILD